MTDQVKPKVKKGKVVFAFIILSIMIVLLPLGSWYYLQSGVDYRKELINDLEDRGVYPVVSQRDWTGVRLDINKDLAKNILITVFFPEHKNNEAIAKNKIEVISKLYEQFDERDDVKFICFSSVRMPETVRNAIATWTGDDPDQFKHIMISRGELNRMANQDFKLDLKVEDENSFFVLSDLDQQIKGAYDSNDSDRVKRLVEHIAFLLPIKRRKSVEMIRETEK